MPTLDSWELERFRSELPIEETTLTFHFDTENESREDGITTQKHFHEGRENKSQHIDRVGTPAILWAQVELSTLQHTLSC